MRVESLLKSAPCANKFLSARSRMSLKPQSNKRQQVCGHTLQKAHGVNLQDVSNPTKTHYNGVHCCPGLCLLHKTWCGQEKEEEKEETEVEGVDLAW
eukprot:scaffold190162_cov19-Tisochrysis_lutea.AAC.1